MTVAVTNVGSGAQSVPYASSQPPAAWRSLQVPVTNTAGDWMVALVTWRQQYAAQGATVHVGDDTFQNFWQPLGQPSGTSSAAGVTRTAIWTAPAACAAQYVLVAPTGAVQAICCLVLGVHGLLPWQTLAAIQNTYINAGTALAALVSGTPAGQSVFFTALGSDLDSASNSLAGSGWTASAFLTTSNGTDHTADLNMNTAWQVSSSSVSATWSSSAPEDMSAVLGGVLVTGTAPVQASAYWPVTVAELAVGAGPNTPADQLTWTSVSARALGLQGVTQGTQYNTAALTAGQGTVLLDNPDGALIVPGTGSFAGIDSGTPFRVRQIWQGGAWQLQWNGNGTTAFPAAESAAILPVIPGQEYSWSAWLASSQPWTAGMYVYLDWQGGSGHISYTTGTPVASGAAAFMATVSETAPAGATGVSAGVDVSGAAPSSSITFSAAAAPLDGAAGSLTVPAGTTWTARNSATVTTLAPWTPDPRGAPSVTPYGQPFAGAIRKWPQNWDPDLYRGQVQATIADAWTYCTGSPQVILIQEILNDGPYAYWPCTDPAGSSQASNYAPGNSNPLVVTASKYGTGAIQQAFGANSEGLLGAQGTYLLSSSVRVQVQSGMWEQSANTYGSGADGWSLLCSDSSFPPLSGGVTYEVWQQALSPYSSYASVILSLSDSTGTRSVTLAFTTAGALTLIASGGGTYQSITVSATDYLTGTSPMLQIVLQITATTYQVFINGVSAASGSWTVTMPPLFRTITANGSAGASFAAGLLSYGCYNAYTGHVAVFPRILSAARIMTHYQAGITAMTGDTPDARIERLLQAAPYYGRRIIVQDSGYYLTPCSSCQDISGQPATTDIQNIASSTPPAVLGVSPAGEIFWLPRSYTWNQTARWTLGEDTSLGEVPYETGYSTDYDPLRVINDVQFTQLDNQDVVLPQAQVETIDLSSQLQYGDQPYWVTGYLENDLLSGYTAGPGLTDAANWTGAVNAKPQNRVAAVTVDCASKPGAWPLFMLAARGQIVTVNRRPVTAPGVVLSITGRISQTTRDLKWSVDGCVATIGLLIDIAPELNVLTADDPVRGQLTGSNILAW
jgi:hypothetical protein